MIAEILSWISFILISLFWLLPTILTIAIIAAIIMGLSNPPRD